MPGTKYRLTVFNQRGKPALSVQVTAWAFFVAPLLLAALMAGDAILFKYYHLYRQTEAAQQQLTLQRLDQGEELVRQAFQVGSMEGSLRHIMDFNAKLRIMLEIADDRDRSSTLAAAPRSTRGLRMLPALYRKNLMRNLWTRLGDLDETMEAEEIRQQDIAHAVAQQLETLGTIPVIMPTQGRFSSPFGWRLDPFTGKKRFHKGIDLTARVGTPVRATANGIVTEATRSPSYGNVLVVTHSDKIKTRYAHLSGFAVKEGQRVLRGQVIGYVGNTGRSKAPHLHYEVQVSGAPVNPFNYILQ